ncbi:hypothetical protein GCM10010401_13460 [Rarobacter faecitabidus]
MVTLRSSRRSLAISAAIAIAFPMVMAGCGVGGSTIDSPSGPPVAEDEASSAAPSPSGPPAPGQPDEAVPYLDLGSFTISSDGDVTYREGAGKTSALDDSTSLVWAPRSATAPYTARFLIEAADVAASALPDGSVVLERDGELVLAIASLEPAQEALARDLADAAGTSAPPSPFASAEWEPARTGAGYEVTALVTAGRLVAIWGTATIESVRWLDRGEGGKSLAATPTALGRLASEAPYRYAMGEVASIAPAADTTVMDKQLRCHLLGARAKESWNLEPWRPDVDFAEYLLARCNP